MNFWFFTLSACFLLGGEDPVEGALPGECADNADNDLDGLYDCFDPDCDADPDCGTGGATGAVTGMATGVPTGTNTGTNTGTPTGTATGLPTDTGDTGVPWTTTGALITVTWLEQGAYDRVQIQGNPPPSGTWVSLGMTDVAYVLYDWTGEDCYVGWSGYHFCHPFNGTLSLDQVSVYGGIPAPGATTFFAADIEQWITYMATTSTGDCYAWGFQPSYYSSLGCQPLP